MNRLLKLTYVATIAGIIAGCGKETGTPANPTVETPTETHSPQTVASQFETPVALPVNPNSSPQEVVLAFLNGMRDGNGAVTAGLLTKKALEETVKHDRPVQPLGTPSASYHLGDAQYVDQTRTTAQVPCIWTEADGTDDVIKFEVIWALRRQEDGWRVAGFATEVVPGRPLFFFNFEDIPSLREVEAAADAAMAEQQANPGNAAGVAAQRPTENVLR